MLNRKKWKRIMQKEQKKSALLLWIQVQLSRIKYDLSDNYCRFYIRDVIEQRGENIIIEIYIQPLSGTFQQIEFKPKIFLSNHNCTSRPRIYNDRRLFHPNINMYTCELVFPEIVKEWNPTQQFISIFQNLKYTVLQPNLKFVPNTEFNKRAAWNYHFNKKNYRNLIIENSPLYLENLIGKEFDAQNQHIMEIEDTIEDRPSHIEEEYWSIQTLTARKHFECGKEQIESYDDEERSILLLTKQIKCLDMKERAVGLAQFINQ